MISYPFRYVWWLLSSLRRSIGRAPEYVIFVLEDGLPTLPDPPGPFWQRFVSRPRLSVKELGDRFDAIARDRRAKGVVLHLRPVPMSMASLQDMRELVSKLRGAGKRVIAWAPFYTTATYYLASACDEILLMPAGLVRPLGFSSTGVFLADGLARVGIKADFVQISPYKSAPDPLTKSKMTPEQREQVTWLLESNHQELVRSIGESRGIELDAAAKLIDDSPYTDSGALDRRVVDGVLPEEQLPDPIDLPLVGQDRAGDLSVVPLARQIAADKNAAAAVLFVNSRGGSSTASEAMRQAVELIAKRKPLVVAMGSAAASGGYLVATPGQWIVARPGTLTGSIGVFTGKLVTSDLFSKLMVNRETVAFGKHVTLEGDDDPFTDEERTIVQKEIGRVYELFLESVGSSRRMTRDEVDPVAGGRVWTGSQALQRKLIDELGGVDTAVRKARSLARLKATAPAREVRAPRRPVAPRAMPTAAGLLGYVLEGIGLLSRAPALAVMEFVPTDPY